MPYTKPFFQHEHHATGLRAPAPVPARYAYHDQDECPVGQRIKEEGDWQYYEPQTKEETRPRCPRCISLAATEARQSASVA